MNRRNMFGILASTPVVVAAKSDFVTVAHKGDMIKEDGKWYSVYDYNSNKSAFDQEYLRRKYGLETGLYIHSRQADGGSDCYYCTYSSEWILLPGTTSSDELDQAFADACINDGVPGVWYE